MADGDKTLKSFLIALNWKSNEAEQRRFTEAIEGATIRAKLLGDAIEAMARKVWEGVSSVASGFEKMFFAAQRNSMTVETVRALGYAFERTGAAASDAGDLMQTLGKHIRDLGVGGVYQAEQVGFAWNKATQQITPSLELMRKNFANQPLPVQQRIGQEWGLSEAQMGSLRQPELFISKYKEALQSNQTFGLDPKKASEDAHAFMDVWSKLSLDMGNIADNILTSFMKAMTGPINEIRKLLEENGPAIKQTISDISVSLGKMTAAWVKDFEEILKHPENLKGMQDAMQGFADAVKSAADSLDRLITYFEKVNEVGNKAAGFLNSLSGANSNGPTPQEQKRRSALLGIGSDFISAMLSPFTGGGGPSMSGGGVNSYAPDGSQNKPLYVKPSDDSSWWGGLKNFLGFGAGAAESGGSGGSGGGSGDSGGSGGRAGLMRRMGHGGVSNSSNAGDLTTLISEAAAKEGIDPRIMEGIRAGESGHGSNYDKKDDAIESSWGPFQLNRRRGLGVEFERDTGLDVRDPSTIPAQAAWVARYIKRHGGTNGQWMGYHGPRDADPSWGNSGYMRAPPAAASAVETGEGYKNFGQLYKEGKLYGHTVTGANNTGAYVDGKWVTFWAHLPGSPENTGQHAASGGASESEVNKDNVQGDHWLKGQTPLAAKVLPKGSRHPYNVNDIFNTTPSLGGAFGARTNHVNSTVNNTFHISGADDPNLVAKQVASRNKRIASDITANMIGATN